MPENGNLQSGQGSESGPNNEGQNENLSGNEDQEGEKVPKNSRINLLAVVDRLLLGNNKIPKTIDAYLDASKEYSAVAEKIVVEISYQKARLNPPKSTIPGQASLPDGEKPNAAEAAVIKRDLKALGKNHRKLSKHIKNFDIVVRKMADNESKSITILELKDKVKDPLYYKKYGGLIPSAIIKFLSCPMTAETLDKLKKIKIESDKLKDDGSDFQEFNSKLGRLLLAADPALHIRCTGTPEKRKEYFTFFKEQLKKWDSSVIKIKKTKRL